MTIMVNPKYQHLFDRVKIKIQGTAVVETPLGEAETEHGKVRLAEGAGRTLRVYLNDQLVLETSNVKE